LFVLDVVGDAGGVAVVGAEVVLDPVAFVADNEMEVSDAGVDEGVRTCSRIGRLIPAGSIGLGRYLVRGRRRKPSPAARTTADVRFI